tara:strand:- start:906 stop:1145 length:240 start_codon:yes stop_codon:yes gene_type:complete
MNLNKLALKESIADTALAMPIAWGLSYLSLLVLMSMGVENAFTLSIFQTMILTVASVTRKYYIRNHFSKRNELKILKSL